MVVWEDLSETRCRNLNAHSTHPNPWRPPNVYESNWAQYSPLFIRTNLQPKYKPNKDTTISLKPYESMAQWGWIGLKYGSWWTVVDIWHLNPTTCPRQMLARWAYIAPVYAFLPSSYIASREILSQVARDKDCLWPYLAATVPTSAIWGLYKGSLGNFARFLSFAFPLAYLYKRYHQNELLFKTRDDTDAIMAEVILNSNEAPLTGDDDPERGWAKRRSDLANHWRIFLGSTPITGANEIEPTWKKFLSEEDQKKGPQLGKY